MSRILFKTTNLDDNETNKQTEHCSGSQMRSGAETGGTDGTVSGLSSKQSSCELKGPLHAERCWGTILCRSTSSDAGVLRSNEK